MALQVCSRLVRQDRAMLQAPATSPGVCGPPKSSEFSSGLQCDQITSCVIRGPTFPSSSREQTPCLILRSLPFKVYGSGWPILS